jgi:hypothetical protein
VADLLDTVVEAHGGLEGSRLATTTTYSDSPGTHMIVVPGGGYAAHAPHEAEPVARWLGEIGVQASVFRYPLQRPAPGAAGRAALAASPVPHAVHVFAHGPHSLGLAQGAGEAAIWTTLASAWIHEQASPPGQTAGGKGGL